MICSHVRLMKILCCFHFKTGQKDKKRGIVGGSCWVALDQTHSWPTTTAMPDSVLVFFAPIMPPLLRSFLSRLCNLKGDLCFCNATLCFYATLRRKILGSFTPTAKQ